MERGRYGKTVKSYGNINSVTPSRKDWRGGLRLVGGLRPDALSTEEIDDADEECEHLHWDQEGNGGDHAVECLVCGTKGAVVWDTDVQKAIADRVRGIT